MQDFIKIPVPADEKLEGVLAHPNTKFKWCGNILAIANSDHPAMMATFEVMEFNNGWHPIETAPRDGTEIQVYTPEEFEAGSSGIATVKWNRGAWTETVADEYRVCNVTHWRALHIPPNK